MSFSVTQMRNVSIVYTRVYLVDCICETQVLARLLISLTLESRLNWSAGMAKGQSTIDTKL